MLSLLAQVSEPSVIDLGSSLQGSPSENMKVGHNLVPVIRQAVGSLSYASDASVAAFFVARLAEAQRFLCAAAILALPSALRTRFALANSAVGGAFSDRTGRPRRLPGREAVAPVIVVWSARSERIRCSFAISVSIASIMRWLNDSFSLPHQCIGACR